MTDDPPIISEIYAWLKRRFPERTDWIHEHFHCFHGVPDELRWLAFTDKFEFEIQNGLLPQLFWNTLFHWKELTAVCRDGYLAFGLAEEASAVTEFAGLFAIHESECRSQRLRCMRTRDFSLFGAWCNSMSKVISSDKEALFFTTSRVRSTKLAWYRENTARLEGLMIQ